MPGTALSALATLLHVILTVTPQDNISMPTVELICRKTFSQVTQIANGKPRGNPCNKHMIFLLSPAACYSLKAVMSD